MTVWAILGAVWLYIEPLIGALTYLFGLGLYSFVVFLCSLDKSDTPYFGGELFTIFTVIQILAWVS